jgi:hypothetical protein
MDQTKRNYAIRLPCPCGVPYFSMGQRYHKCPNCEHVWDLRPDMEEDIAEIKKILDVNDTQRPSEPSE